MQRLMLLSLLIISTLAYGQQPQLIGTAEPGFEVGDTEISFVGDTMLIRLMSNHKDPQQQAAWYDTNGKISDVDMSSFGNANVMGIVPRSDTLFYYLSKDGKENQITVFTSVGLNAVKEGASIATAGPAIRGFKRGENFLVITWEQKNQIVHFYTLRGNHLIADQQLQLDKELLKFSANDIAFPVAGEPGRISVMKTTLRFFLNGDTFAAVYDMPGSLYPQEVAKYKTRVVRFNLLTGKQSDQSMFSYKTFAFKSFLLGSNRLYRLAISKDSCKINIHDLDNRAKVIGSYPMIVPGKEPVAVNRHGSEHTIEHQWMFDMSGFRAKPNFDVGIMVDEYNDQQIISVGVINNSKGGTFGPGSGMPLASIISAIAATSMMQLKDDPNNIKYMYLRGIPAAGYKVAKSEELGDFFKGRFDNFEFDSQKEGKVDYMAHFTNSHYGISVTSYKNSSQYRITKFPLQP